MTDAARAEAFRWWLRGWSASEEAREADQRQELDAAAAGEQELREFFFAPFERSAPRRRR